MEENKEVKEHIQEKIIIDYSVIPTHESRQNPELAHEFEKAKQQMKKDGFVKCFICDCESTPENHIEYHHFLVEDCFNESASMDKLWELAKIFDIYGYAHKAIEAPKDCNHPMNLIPLCHKHHTGAEGIHSETFSTFIIQKLVKDNLTEEENPVPQDMEELKKLKKDYENKIENKKGYNE